MTNRARFNAGLFVFNGVVVGGMCAESAPRNEKVGMTYEVDESRRGTPADRPGRMPRIKWTKPRADDEPPPARLVPQHTFTSGLSERVRDVMDAVREQLGADAWEHLIDQLAASRGLDGRDASTRASLRQHLEENCGLRLTVFVHASMSHAEADGGAPATPPPLPVVPVAEVVADVAGDDPRAGERGLALRPPAEEPRITVVPNPLVAAVSRFQRPA